MRFRATLESGGKTATGIEIPAKVVEALGSGRKPPVRITIGGHTYRSTVASRGDRYLVGVSAENRALAGVAAGDEVDVDIELDTAPREVAVPTDLATALDADAEARRFFEALSFSQKQWYVIPIEQAKKPETRTRRIEKALAMLRAGRKALRAARNPQSQFWPAIAGWARVVSNHRPLACEASALPLSYAPFGGRF
jgi:Bacteriocin-protection, YdeI or OmpD-Associated/Domain of unknown function (DUF1905)